MKNQLKTIVLLGALSAVLVALGGSLGTGWLYGALGFAALMNVGAYFFSDRLVLAMHGAREVSPAEAPWLHATVEELAARAGIPKPRVALLPSPQPNAFATGRSPRHGVVAVTQGLTQLLDRRELRGVLAHEIAHIANRDILLSSIAAVLAAAITYLAHALAFLPVGGSSDDEDGGAGIFGTLLLVIAAPILGTVIQLGLSRSREYLADETGARLSGDPNALADALLALERGSTLIPMEAQPATASLFIVNPLAGQGSVRDLFSTHPRTAERVARLRALSQTLPAVHATHWAWRRAV